MKSLAFQLAPVGETMFLSCGDAARTRAPAAGQLAAAGFPPRAPFFQRPMFMGEPPGSPGPLPTHRPRVGR